jgi:hypothetical protein
MKSSTSPDAARWRALHALLFLPLVVYVILPTRNYYWDGIGIAGDIEKHQILLYPSHLLFSLSGSWLYALASAIGLKTRALFLMQGANCLFAGFSVPLFYRLLRSAGAAASSSVAGALIFAFSATWWKFATDANAYVPSIFFLLCAYVLLEDGRPIPAALAHAIAMLFHELAILFLPVAWILLRGRRRVEYSALALAPVFAAYVIACRVALGGISLFRLLSWATVHSPDSTFSFNPLRDAALTIRGTGRLLFGGRLVDFSGFWVSKLALAGFAISAAFFLWTLARSSASEKSIKPPLPILLWTGGYVVFLFFWMPQNTFYRLFYLAPLIAIGILLWRRPAAWLIPALFLSNFAFLIYPDSQTSHNAPLSFALAQRDRWPPGTPIVFYHFHPDLWTISYFVPGTSWFGLDRADISTLDRELEYAHTQQQPLWIEADAYNMIAVGSEGRSWLANHERPAERIEFKDERHHFLFYCAR